jgi:hypothetical protein
MNQILAFQGMETEDTLLAAPPVSSRLSFICCL